MVVMIKVSIQIHYVIKNQSLKEQNINKDVFLMDNPLP